MGVYFGIMGVFSGIAMLMEQYWMGAVMGGSAALLYVAYNLDRSYRRKQLLKYLEKEENAMESSGRGEAPFPAVMVRLGDGTIVWTNQLFSKMTGFNDTMKEHDLRDLVPELSVDWRSGRPSVPRMLPSTAAATGSTAR